MNSTCENNQDVNLIVDQPHNSKKALSINLSNSEENKKHSPLIFPNIPTFADSQQLNSAEIVSLSLPYLKNSNSFSKSIPKRTLSSSMPHNQPYPMQNINIGPRNSFNPQQLIFSSLDSAKEADKLPNPLFSSNSVNHNPSLLTGSSNFSPIDIHNPLMRNSFMIPTYNAVFDGFSGKQSTSFSPLNLTAKPSFTRYDERELEEFKNIQSEKTNKDLKKTTKKVEKRKKPKHSPNKRKNSTRKSISATGAIKPQLLEIDNSMFYNNIAEPSFFESLDFNHVDAQRANPFSPLSTTEYNESFNLVDPNNMFARKSTVSGYKVLTPGLASNGANTEYASLMNGHNTFTRTREQDSRVDDNESYKVDYEDAFMNISQRYSTNYDMNDLPSGTTDQQNFTLESDPKHESDMNFINFLALKEKVNGGGNKVTKKKKTSVDRETFLNFESNSKSKSVATMKRGPKRTVKRGRKPKPIHITDQKSPSKPTVKGEITTDDNVAPQYINFDNGNDAASKVLTESTKRVIDEIKHNALNGNGSIVNFLPLLEIPSYQPHLHNSGSTLPVSLSSARQLPKSSVHTYGMMPTGDQPYGVLNTGEHMVDIKKVSPFDSMAGSSMNSSVSTFNHPLKTHEEGNEKASANSDKSSNIKAALKSTMRAIKDSTGKPKLKMINSSALDFFPNNYEQTKDIDMEKLGEVGKRDLASNDSIKAQFLGLQNDNDNRVIDNYTVLNDDEDTRPGTVKISRKEIPTQRQGFALKKRLGNVNSNIKQSSDDKETTGNDTCEEGNSKREIIQSLERMFSERPAKRKPMKKAQYINISTQVLKPTGNLLVKTSVVDRPQVQKRLDKAQKAKNTETARKNLNMTWLKDSSNNIIKLAHKSIVQALNSDPHFTTESLTKNKKGLFSCLHCELKFSNIQQYAEHLDEVEVSGPYKCPFVECCWKYFGMKTTQKLRRHCALQHISELTDEMKTILNIKSDSYPEIACTSEYCDKTFIRKDFILRHQQMVHNNPNSRFNNRLNKVKHFIDHHYSQLKEDEKKILVKQYMKGALNLPSSYRVKKKEDV